LKGRFQESHRDDDHHLSTETRPVPAVEGDNVAERTVPTLFALNETLREDYIADCQKGVDRWNRQLAEVGLELRLPDVGFNRAVGVFANHHVSPDGRLIDESEWNARVGSWLPTDDDAAFVASLMTPAHRPGEMAGWIAPPANGIHQKPVEYEYVRAS